MADSRTIPADAAGIAMAVDLLAEGQAVALPTETVYGLAADAGSARAVAEIYAIKSRPSFNPLIAHVTGREMAEGLVEATPLATVLMERFWPGPLTIVLPLRPGARIAALATAGLETLAVRTPDHPVILEILAALDRPLAAPSANRSGALSPTTAAHVRDSLGDLVPLILDGGPTRAGVESTIVSIEQDRVRLVRPGALPVEELGTEVLPQTMSLIAPGQLPSHYAPRQPLRIEATSADSSEFHIGFGDVVGDASLSERGDCREAAARLFEILHEAQASGRSAIAVAPVPERGLGVAINDRLRRAAAPRAPDQPA